MERLVPLLMALRQETVRLLIGDDVGIGKTIEARSWSASFWFDGKSTSSWWQRHAR